MHSESSKKPVLKQFYPDMAETEKNFAPLITLR
jgi:hypothetical protein